MEGMKTAANAYQSVQIDSAVLGASPHELIAKLLFRAIESIVSAKNYMLNGNIGAKGQEIKFATSIIADGLRACLNLEAGGEIAANLDNLYDYMLRQLVKAHAENDPAILDEVIALLKEIKAGWDGIKPE
jgi:flagellar protein FliS